LLFEKLQSTTISRQFFEFVVRFSEILLLQQQSQRISFN